MKYPLILPLRERVRAEILNWLKCEEKDLSIPLSYTLLSNAVLLVEEGLGCAFCLDGALAIHSSPRLWFIPSGRNIPPAAYWCGRKIISFHRLRLCLSRRLI